MVANGKSWLGLALIIVGLLLNGLGAGLALPALHRAAMEGPEGERGGAAAGVYSMIRFWGMMLGTAVAGVLLQSLLDRGTAALASYRWVYAATGLVGFVGVVAAIALPKEQ
jgi:MFS family permease